MIIVRKVRNQTCHVCNHRMINSVVHRLIRTCTNLKLVHNLASHNLYAQMMLVVKYLLQHISWDKNTEHDILGTYLTQYDICLVLGVSI